MPARLSSVQYARYKVTKTYFRGKRAPGRTTTVIDKEDGRSLELMGDLTKAEAIRSYIARRALAR